MSSPLTTSTLWDALYSWAHGVLPNVEIVQSHENAPSPSGNFICIDYAGTWNLRGSSASKMIDGREDLISPRVYTYSGSVQIRDVEGDGENLMLLLESLEDPNTLSAFGTNGLSVLRSTGPMAMPMLQQTEWRKESVLTLQMAWSRAYSGTTLEIKSVEIEQKFADSEKNNLILIETQEAQHGA